MFTIDQINAMSNEELRGALVTIQDEMRTANNLDEYAPIVDAITSRLQAVQQRADLMGRVAAGLEGTNPRPAVPAQTPAAENRYTIESPEYRSAFLKVHMDQDLTPEERAAYVAVTTDSTSGTPNLLPKTLLNMIWDQIDEQHAILGDITLYRTGTILELATRESIAQGDAATVNENAANQDEKNIWGKVTLAGKDFSKHVDIGYAMAKMSIDAFETFLANEIATRLGAALAADVVAQIKADCDSTNKALKTAATGEFAFKDFATAMGALKNANGQCVVYANRKTVYEHLVGMVDTAKRPVFQLNAQNGAEGALIGCPVKVEDAFANDEFAIGYPKDVVGNMVQDIMLESDKDIKKHVITYSGYARFECKLVSPKGFAILTKKTA